MFCEKAHQRLELLAAAAGDRRADDDVGLPRVAVEQHVEGREGRHEQRRAVFSAQLVHRDNDVLRQRELERAAAVRLHRRTGSVRRQLKRGHARKPGYPEGELLLEHFALHPAVLPGCEVGVLHAKVGQPWRAPFR